MARPPVRTDPAANTALAVAAVLSVVLAVLVVATLARDGAPFAVDTSVHRWVVAHRPTLLTRVAVAVTTTGTGPVAYLLAAGAGAAVGRRNRLRAVGGALVGVVALTAGQLLRVALATWIGRPRPPAADWARHVSGPSLPSGHTTTSALVAALLCLAVARTVGPGRRRTAMTALALLWAVSVGLTRVYLGVHWPTDVLAGWLFAGVLVLVAGVLLPRATWERAH